MIAKCEVLASTRETPTVHTLRVAKPAGFRFLPVQFCGLEFDTDAGSEEYTMSLACSPTRDYLEFGARLSGSAWKRAFGAMKPGDVVEVDGAYGHFVLEETRPAVLVAGGIGITPLKGMLQYATDKKLRVPVRLLYSNKTPEEIAYRAEIEALLKANPHASVTYTLTQPSPSWKGPTGRIGTAMLREAAAGLDRPVYYVCGKPGMVEGMVVALVKELGVPRGDVRYEQFWGY